MEKDLFLTLLSLHLSEGDMPKDEVDRRIKYFDSHLSSLSEEECAKKIEELGGDKKVAEKLLKDYRRAVAKSAEQPAEEATIVATPDETPKKADDAEKKESAEVNVNDTSKKENDINNLLNEDDDSDVKRVPSEKSQPKPRNNPQKKNTAKKAPAKKSPKSSKAKKEITPFTIGLIILSPVILFFLLIIATLLASLFVAVAGLILCSAALLVLITAAGTAFALVAMIYGITQLGVTMPAGIYEIGIGIAAGGITMLVGILLYNFVVRLAPFLFKKLVVLVKFVIAQLKRLYESAKGAFDKI